MPENALPLAFVRDLRCFHCSDVLSCGPVYNLPNNAVLCGRCKTISKYIYRNFAFETLASLYRYPCRNYENHCNEYLIWNESLQHEGKCIYNGGCKLFCSHPSAFCASKRHLPVKTQEVTLIPVPEELLDKIQCIVCECYLSCAPVYIGEQGQNICHRCVTTQGAPPNCFRNLMYEKIAELLFLFPCIYRNRGCAVRENFGQNLWEHENACHYGQMYKKKEQIIQNGKQRGLIKTQTGHYYGTIKEGDVKLFAPPDKPDNTEINKQLVKSIKRKQESKHLRQSVEAEHFGSEDGSVITEESGRSSPNTPSDELSRFRYQNEVNSNRHYIPEQYDRYQQSYQPRGYPQNMNFYPGAPRDYSFYPNNPNDLYSREPLRQQPNSFPGQYPHESYMEDTSDYSRQSSFNSLDSIPSMPARSVNPNNLILNPNNLPLQQKRESFRLHPSDSFNQNPQNFAGQYPRLDTSESFRHNPTIYDPNRKDSFRQRPSDSFRQNNFAPVQRHGSNTQREMYNPDFDINYKYYTNHNNNVIMSPIDRSDSKISNSSRQLIEELQTKFHKGIKADQISEANRDFNDIGNPYKECQNLGDIIQVQDDVFSRGRMIES